MLRWGWLGLLHMAMVHVRNKADSRIGRSRPAVQLLWTFREAEVDDVSIECRKAQQGLAINETARRHHVGMFLGPEHPPPSITTKATNGGL
jgi:hypothetical protein